MVGACIGLVAAFVVAVAVTVRVAPLCGVVLEGVCTRAFAVRAPILGGVRPTVAVAVWASQTVPERVPDHVWTPVRRPGIRVVTDAIAVGVGPLRAVQREGIGHCGALETLTWPVRRPVGGPGRIVVVVPVPVTVRVVPLLWVHREGVAALVDVQLVGLVDVVEVVVPVAVLIRVSPLLGVPGPDVCTVKDAPSGIRIRIAVSIGVQAAESIHVGGPCGVHASIGLRGGRRVVPVAVTVGIVPLRTVRWEGIHDAVALVRGVVAVIVLVNVCEPVVHALVIPAMSGDDVVAVRAPGDAVKHAAIVVGT